MSQATYILTYRADRDGQRRRNLEAVLAWLAGFAQVDVIVVEQDVAPTPLAPAQPRCQALFAYNPGPFNKSWGFNVGFRAARTQWLGFGDADVIVGDALWQSFQLLREGLFAVKPYRRFIDLTEEESRPVRAGDFARVPARDPRAPPGRQGIGEHVVFAGGSFVIHRDAFVALGGWDERFVGWGGEDDAFSYRIERSRMACTELDTAPAMHLWHERSRDATFAQPFYDANRRLLEEYRGYADVQLERLAEVQMQVLGHREKYRPHST
jgi:hypothetical protein